MARDLINRLIAYLPEALLMSGNSASASVVNFDIHAKSAMRFIGAVTEYGLIEGPLTVKLVQEVMQ